MLGRVHFQQYAKSIYQGAPLRCAPAFGRTEGKILRFLTHRLHGGLNNSAPSKKRTGLV